MPAYTVVRRRMARMTTTAIRRTAPAATATSKPPKNAPKSGCAATPKGSRRAGLRPPLTIAVAPLRRTNCAKLPAQFVQLRSVNCKTAGRSAAPERTAREGRAMPAEPGSRRTAAPRRDNCLATPPPNSRPGAEEQTAHEHEPPQGRMTRLGAWHQNNAPCTVARSEARSCDSAIESRPARPGTSR